MSLFNLFRRFRNKKTKEREQNAKSDNIAGKNDFVEGNINDKSDRCYEDCRSSFYKLEDLKSRSMGALMLVPYDAQAYLEYDDANLLRLLANSDKIRKYLPGLNFSDESSIKKMLYTCILQTESQLGVTYVIRKGLFPLGMIFIHTPLFNKKAINLSVWTIDFFILEMAEHQGIMFQSLIRTLHEMKTIMNVDVVYALVDKNNTDCINLIGRGLFSEVDNTGFENNINGEKPLVYMLNLSTINFVKK